VKLTHDELFISAPTQIFSIVISFLSLGMSSVKLFYSQRFGKYQEVDATIPMIVFNFPFIMCLLAGPLCNLVLVASYYQGWVILFIFLIILSNCIILFTLFRNKLLFVVGMKFGYDKDENPELTNEKLELVRQQNDVKILTAVLTAWVSPCSVLSNNRNYKSKFLLVSSLTSFIGHIIGICSIALHVKFSDPSLMSNPPIFHCFKPNSYK